MKRIRLKSYHVPLVLFAVAIVLGLMGLGSAEVGPSYIYRP